MKNKIINLILIVTLIITSYGCKAQSIATQIQQNLEILESAIRGTWISTDDPNWSIEFNANGYCYWYYTNEATETFTYSILTTSPQCDQNVPTGGLQDFYLNLVDQEDNTILCYEILGVNEDSLSISTIGLGVKIYLFTKQ